MAKTSFILDGARGRVGNIIVKAQPGGGTQITARPASVSNPKTAGQIQVRSKLKLLSQLAASVDDVIAISREGKLSARNQFISVNSGKVVTTNGVAQITLENVQITKSNRALPQIVATRNAVGAEPSLKMEMANDVTALASRVVYVIMRKNSEGSLEQVASAIVSVTSENPKATAEFKAQDLSGDNILIWSYGILDKDSAATVKYGDMKVEAASDIAKLVVNKTFSVEDYAFTQTRGASMGAGVIEIVPTEEGKVRVFATALGDGTVNGSGTYTIGANVTLTATAVKPEGAESTAFLGWRQNGQTSGYVSTANPYTFEAPAETVDLVAVFSTTYPSGGGMDQN